ncbi:MAG: M48 family metallopeptidase [Gaiellales bacterium]
MSKPRFTERPPIMLDLGTETLSVPVRQSRRARATRIVVGPARPLEVIAAAGATEQQIADFLRSRRRWIREKLEWSRELSTRPSRLGLDLPGVVHRFGETVPVMVRRSGSRSAVMCGRVLCAPSVGDRAAAVERWYRREAAGHARTLLEQHAVRLGVTPASLAIRDSRTRWGSCSSAGRISLSWRLVLAPREALEYVVVHELCHLIEANHSRSFWRLLDAAHPQWPAAARWLREHGLELNAYDVRMSLVAATDAAV